MTILLRGSDNGVTSTGGSIDVTKPSGTLEGDLIIINYSLDQDVLPDTPTGFTRHYSDNTGSDTSILCVFYKVAGASEPASWTITTNNTASAKASCESYYSDVGGGTWEVDAAATSVQSTSGQPCSIGPLSVTSGAMLLGQWQNDSDSSVTSPPSGMTQTTLGQSGGSCAITSYRELISGDGSETKSLTYNADQTIGGLFQVRYIGAPPSATLTLDQASISPGGTITFSTDLAGFAYVWMTDSAGNRFDFTNVIDNGDGTGSADLPPLTHGQSACLFENDLTVTVSTEAPA